MATECQVATAVLVPCIVFLMHRLLRCHDREVAAKDAHARDLRLFARAARDVVLPDPPPQRAEELRP